MRNKARLHKLVGFSNGFAIGTIAEYCYRVNAGTLQIALLSLLVVTFAINLFVKEE
jgi:hypothetical protein